MTTSDVLDLASILGENTSKSISLDTPTTAVSDNSSTSTFEAPLQSTSKKSNLIRNHRRPHSFRRRKNTLIQASVQEKTPVSIPNNISAQDTTGAQIQVSPVSPVIAPTPTPTAADRFQEELRLSYTAIGQLELTAAGYGFLRKNYTVSPHTDVYVSQNIVRKFFLRAGDTIEGRARMPRVGEKYSNLLIVDKINDTVMTEQESFTRIHFENLTSKHPEKHIRLEFTQNNLATRITDLIAPIGFGQRALIVSQPKAGKTSFLKDIAEGISHNHPHVVLIAVLIGERPEEVTDMRSSLQGEVAASNFDDSPLHQVKVANMALNRAKRLVEQGKDVVILLDSITRLARAFNLAGPTDQDGNPLGKPMRNNRGGRDFYHGNRGSMSGGMNQQALYPAKKFLGAARNCIEGGSLTIVGTALIETESRMDNLIYEEFKGTGNMEIHLDRKFAEKRIFPAINIPQSSTRKEELLFDEQTYKRITTLRRMLAMLNEEEALASMIVRIGKTKTNEEFLASLNK